MSPLDSALANVAEHKSTMTPAQLAAMDAMSRFMQTAASVYGCDSSSPEFLAAWLLACSFLSRLAHQEEGENGQALGDACQELTSLGLWSSLFGVMDLPPFNENDARTP